MCRRESRRNHGCQFSDLVTIKIYDFLSVISLILEICRTYPAIMYMVEGIALIILFYLEKFGLVGNPWREFRTACVVEDDI